MSNSEAIECRLDQGLMHAADDVVDRAGGVVDCRRLTVSERGAHAIDREHVARSAACSPDRRRTSGGR